MSVHYIRTVGQFSEFDNKMHGARPAAVGKEFWQVYQRFTTNATFMSSSFPNATDTTEDSHNDMEYKHPTFRGVRICRQNCNIPNSVRRNSRSVSMANTPAFQFKVATKRRPSYEEHIPVLLTDRYRDIQLGIERFFMKS